MRSFELGDREAGLDSREGDTSIGFESGSLEDVGAAIVDRGAMATVRESGENR